MLVGRVLEVEGLTGSAEFTSQVRVGDFIYYVDPSDGARIMCEVTKLRSAPIKGIHGSFRILDLKGGLPKSYMDLYSQDELLMDGFIEVGVDRRGMPIRLPLNPFFLHVLAAGMTQQGKSHFLIVCTEEFLSHGVPSLVIDTQGEFIHLSEFSDHAIVEDLPFGNLLEELKHKKTVVYNLQGLPYRDKQRRAREILSQLMRIKERDYKEAEESKRAPSIPPVLITIDEAEIYAPNHGRSSDTDATMSTETIVDIAKRGSKYGLGLILASQQVPQLELAVRSQCNSAALFHICDEGDRQVLRMFKYIGSLHLGKLKNFNRGQCILAGRIVPYPTVALIRDIRTRRAKNTDFEEILHIDTAGRAAPDPLPAAAAEELTSLPPEAKASSCLPCPDCGKPLVFNRGRYECLNDECSVLQVKAGKATRAAAIKIMQSAMKKEA